MAKYTVARDVGTSGNKAVLLDTEARILYTGNIANKTCQEMEWLRLSPT